MDPSPIELRNLLLVVATSLVAVVAATVALVRSGRAVQLPDAAPGAERAPGSGREDRVSSS